jgi:anti-sigma factor RsiW
MDCKEASKLFHAYVDGELDVIKSAEVDGHLAGCPVCSAETNGLHQLKSSLSGLYYRAPVTLERRVTAAIVAADKSAARPGWQVSSGWRAAALVAALILAIVAGWIVINRRTSSASLDLVAAEVVDSHIRSLMANHLEDVPSTDQHTVKPWFNGRLDFSPSVRDLANEGFSLIGGRLDYIAGHPAAALIYQRRQHYINLFEWPSAGPDEPARSLSERGYNAIHWNEQGTAYWAVSDLNRDELSEFVNDLASSAGH